MSHVKVLLSGVFGEDWSEGGFHQQGNRIKMESKGSIKLL